MTTRLLRRALASAPGQRHTLSCLVFVPLLGLSACGESVLPEEDTLEAAVAFVGATVVPMTQPDLAIPDQTVLILDDRIVAVGARDAVSVPEGAMQIDGTGSYLMPGLADMHVHLEYFDDPSVLDLFLANGVTTVRNMDGRPYIIDWRDRIAAGEMQGPTIVTAGPLLDGDPPLRDDNTVVATPAEALAAVNAQADLGYDFIKVYTNLSAEAYNAVISTASERGLSVVGHVPRTVRVDAVLSSGQRSIEHLTDYGDLVESDDSPFRDQFHWSKLYFGMPVDPAKLARAAQQLAGSGVWTVPTAVQADKGIARSSTIAAWLAAPEIAYVGAEGRDFWQTLSTEQTDRMDEADWQLAEQGRANRLAMIRALDAAGANLLVGTDTPNPFVIPGFSLHEELDNFVAAGLDPGRALIAATRDAARFLRRSDAFGTIEVGKRADLLLLTGNPLDGLETVRTPLGVMVRGTWLSREELDRRLAAIREAGGL